ncbi:MAG TPA: hypothetical protein VJ044_20380, partial [Candidatus Hodarchaeales archaeon]|nr:hypothetical protein [Candidatus Hodarchaeales archaeon]
MPYLPLTSHFGLVKGEYQVRFKCGLQLVEGLRRYTPDYCERAAELDEILGHISVPKDFVTVEKRPINEFHYIVTRQTPGKQKRVSSTSRVASNSANPEYYFEEHLLEPARRINRDRDKAFHPIRVHGHDSSQVGTPFVQNQRSFGGYCGSLALAYRLTGKAEYYHASRYAYELLEKNIWKTKWGWGIGLETFREGENLLEFGICAQNMFEFFKITEERKLLQKVHRVLRSWPYDKKNHLPFVEVDRDGKEIHPSYPFNMVAVGCAAMWLVGEVFEDELLRSRVKETVHSFLLPMMEKDGHWQYAFHYEEKKKYPEPRGYHYDLFTKMNLSRLMEYEEWRRDHSFMNAMVKGIEFSLMICAKEKSGLLEWSGLYTSGRGPHFAINHAGLMVGYLALLAKYVDKK